MKALRKFLIASCVALGLVTALGFAYGKAFPRSAENGTDYEGIDICEEERYTNEKIVVRSADPKQSTVSENGQMETPSGAVGTVKRSYASSTYYTPTPIPELKKLYAFYRGSSVVVGEQVDRQNIVVRGTYSDGTTRDINDYEIYDDYIWEEGTAKNTVYVYYEGQEASFKVTGKAPLEIVKITATYKGSGVIVSNKIPREDLEVKVHYNWAEVKPDVIKNYELYPETIEYTGINKVEVIYEGVPPVTVQVQGLAKIITKIEVNYLGNGEQIGAYLDPENIEFLAYYNDGSMEEIYDYKMTGDLIRREGANIVVFSYKGYVQRLEIEGKTEAEKPTTAKDIFSDSKFEGDASTVVTLMVSADKRAQSFNVSYVPWDLIENAVSQIAYGSMYLGFEVSYTDPEAVLEFPLYCKVQRPEDFDAEHFSIYYSPNKKTIMAKVAGEWLTDEKNNYVFTMYEPGIYIMIDEQQGQPVTSINVDSTKMKLKLNRNYSLNPVVLPMSADNRDVIYWSSDSDIVEVNDKGKMKAHSVGSCQIWIEATDGSGVFTVIDVTVTEK